MLNLGQDKVFPGLTWNPRQTRRRGRGRKPRGSLSAPTPPWFPATSLSISHLMCYIVALDHSRGIQSVFCEVQRPQAGVHRLHGKLIQAEQNLDPQKPGAVLLLSLVCWVSL